MKKVLTAAVMLILAVCVGTSVSWGQSASTESATWESATWESATWETLDGVSSVWE